MSSIGLTVIDGGASPRSCRSREGDEQILCQRCEQDTEVATSLGIQVVQSPMRRRGRVTGGVRKMVCVHCLARGVVTVLA